VNVVPSIVQWVIYFDPLDQPGKYVARQWIIAGGKIMPVHISYASNTLEDAREHIPEGMVNLGRFAHDEPQIVEVWI
jgi:hypothetical protein